MPGENPAQLTPGAGNAPEPPLRVMPAAAGQVPEPEVLRALIAALGGRSNVRGVEPASSRLRVRLANTSAIDGAEIRKLGMRGVAIATTDCVHIIVGPAAEAAAASLRELLAS